VNAAETVSYVVELDLVDVPEAESDRTALLGALSYALITAVRRPRPVTNVEVVFGTDSVLIARAHDLTRAALNDRLRSAAVSAPVDGPHITVIDVPGAPFTATGPQPGRLLSVSIGPVQTRLFSAGSRQADPSAAIAPRPMPESGTGPCAATNCGSSEIAKTLTPLAQVFLDLARDVAADVNAGRNCRA
jgi:hypothetical protein